MLRRKLYRDLWHYKGQFFTIFLMVFIGMLAFSGIHGYMDGMDESAKAVSYTHLTLPTNREV